MTIEQLIWGYLPSIVALVTMITSAFLAVKARRSFHFLFSFIVLLLDAFALALLFMIFVVGRWPIYLPHVLIGVTVCLVFVQAIVFWRRRLD